MPKVYPMNATITLDRGLLPLATCLPHLHIAYRWGDGDELAAAARVKAR